jgi:hypothetical protein
MLKYNIVSIHSQSIFIIIILMLIITLICTCKSVEWTQICNIQNVPNVLYDRRPRLVGKYGKSLRTKSFRESVSSVSHTGICQRGRNIDRHVVVEYRNETKSRIIVWPGICDGGTVGTLYSITGYRHTVANFRRCDGFHFVVWTVDRSSRFV